MNVEVGAQENNPKFKEIKDYLPLGDEDDDLEDDDEDEEDEEEEEEDDEE